MTTLTIDRLMTAFGNPEEDALIADIIRNYQGQTKPCRDPLVALDVDWNMMLYHAEIEDRAARLELFGIPYTLDRRKTDFAQHGIHWYRDEHGVARVSGYT